MAKKSQNKSSRSCLSFLLTIMLKSIPKHIGPQPAQVQLLFYRYCHQMAPPISIQDSTISSWKKDKRAFDQDILDFYMRFPDTLREDFRGKVVPVLEDPTEAAGDFCTAIRRSNAPEKIKQKLLPESVQALSPEDCSDFLADSLLYFMQHPEYTLKCGVAAPPPDFIRESKVPAPCRFFCGREGETQLLYDLLNKYDHVFLSGFSGIGKSELARKYALEYSQDYSSPYKHTLSVVFRESLRETIIHLPFHCDTEIKQHYSEKRDQLMSALCNAPDPNSYLQTALENLKKEYTDELFSAHDQLLQTLGPDALLIIDNYNIDRDPLLSKVLDYSCHILFTTQHCYQNYPHLELEEIQDQDVLMDLVSRYYEQAPDHPEEIREILTLLHGHTFFVELSSRLLGMGALTLQEMLTKFRHQNVKMDADDPIQARKDSTDLSDTFHGFVRILFPFFHMNEAEQYILTNLALLPPGGIHLTIFKDWISTISEEQASSPERKNEHQHISAIYSLIEKGLIQNHLGVLSMHTLIQEVVVAEEELTPSVKRCRFLLSHLIELCQNYHQDLGYWNIIFLTLMNFVDLGTKDEKQFYISLLYDAHYACIYHCFAPGASLFSQELIAEENFMESRDAIIYQSANHYLKACSARSPEQALSEYVNVIEPLCCRPFDQITEDDYREAFIALINTVADTTGDLLYELTGVKSAEEMIDVIMTEFTNAITSQGRPKDSTIPLPYVLDLIIKNCVNIYQGNYPIPFGDIIKYFEDLDKLDKIE